MNAAAARPSLTELNRLINKVPAYPLSVRQLLKLAAEKRAPAEVKSFYRAFPNDMVFDNQEDLAARTEQVKVLHREEGDMPAEELRASEED